MDERLFSSKQTVIDWLADVYQADVDKMGTSILARRKLAEITQDLLYCATGHQFEVRQVIPPPSNPRPVRRGF